MKPALLFAIGCGASHPSASPTKRPFDAAPELIPGGFSADRAPDGNSIVFDAPKGLVVVDTGRHPEHQERLLALAKSRGKPIAAIVNTHWHLDHTGGNAELRATFPKVEIVATTAIEGALVDFFPRGRPMGDKMLADPDVPESRKAEIRLDHGATDDPSSLRPTRAVTTSGPLDLAGRRFDVHVTSFAATEADLWLYDAASKTVVAGDLVVAAVPFFDTGCPDGWRRALGEIAVIDFDTLIPGHGETMSKAQFATWRRAFDALIDCAASSSEPAVCVSGWRRDAESFIPKDQMAMIDEMVGYYVTEILRSPKARERFCKVGV